MTLATTEIALKAYSTLRACENKHCKKELEKQMPISAETMETRRFACDLTKCSSSIKNLYKKLVTVYTTELEDMKMYVKQKDLPKDQKRVAQEYIKTRTDKLKILKKIDPEHLSIKDIRTFV